MADLLYRGSFSPLHKVNPNMVPMTFWGMQMLNSLWDDVCSVPPLTSNPERQITLLETMPGAALRDFGLPHKGYKKGKEALEKREKILKELSIAHLCRCPTCPVLRRPASKVTIAWTHW